MVENCYEGFNFFWIEIPQTTFHAELDIDFLENSFKHCLHLVGVRQKTAASFLVGYPRKWAAHIEVDFLVAQLFALFGKTQDFLSIGAENLWCKDFDIVIFRVNFLTLQVFCVVLFMDAREKRRVELVNPTKMLLEHVTERRISNALEGS